MFAHTFFIVVEKQLDDLKKEHEHIKGNLSFTDQFNDIRLVSMSFVCF